MAKPNTAGKPGGLSFDADALARAEAALKSLSSEFEKWMGDEVVRMTAARQAARQTNYAEPALLALYSSAHDIKGLGSTYDYPLATLIAASLCKLIETPAGRDRARTKPAVVEAHVDAIRAAYKAQIKTNEHPVGRELLAELNKQVALLTADIAP
ncbi:MAG: Hpt domain-containing protein [Alphaproteobacteria bacterium]|nr:Hpt domain-containing protein [Alphaproteobacteria bacterium]